MIPEPCPRCGWQYSEEDLNGKFRIRFDPLPIHVCGPAAARSGDCPLACGYSYPIPACVRLHLIQHHDFTYAEAQAAYPNDEPGAA